MNLLHWRAHALGVVVAAAAGTVLSCRDTGTAPPDAARSARSQSAHAVPRADRTDPPVQPVRPRQAAPDLVARGKLHRRNPMDWVGAAHNRALDAFRDELREPGVLSRSVCSYLLTFATSDARVPAEHARAKAALGAAARRRAASKGLAATELCGRRIAGPSAQIVPRVWLAAFSPAYRPVTPAVIPHAQSGELSQAARDLYAQIETAVDVAASSYDLAGQLNPVLDAAAQLSAEEYATIAATVSVAQYSYEYWEAQLPSYIEAVSAEYGSCFEESQQLGYTLADAENRCMNGAAIEPVDRRGARANWRLPLLMVVARPSSPGAVRQTVGQGLKAIGKRDAYGAFTGAFAGAFAGGVQGAALGAIIGGSGASIATALGLAGSAIWNHQYR
jgi:hypothetical protein